VHRRVLPQVEAAEVEAEHLDGLAHPAQPVVGECARTVAAQGRVDDVQIGAQFVRAVVAVQLDVGWRPGDVPEHRRRGRAQPVGDAS
jgi:hypothetical protein